MKPDTSVPNEQLVSVYMSTDTSSKQCSTRGYKWIHVAVTTILSPIQDYVDGDVPRLQLIHVARVQVVSTCIREYNTA